MSHLSGSVQHCYSGFYIRMKPWMRTIVLPNFPSQETFNFLGMFKLHQKIILQKDLYYNIGKMWKSPKITEQGSIFRVTHYLPQVDCGNPQLPLGNWHIPGCLLSSRVAFSPILSPLYPGNPFHPEPLKSTVLRARRR
jgi:hypothetical protein